LNDEANWLVTRAAGDKISADISSPNMATKMAIKQLLNVKTVVVKASILKHRWLPLTL
jgi:hypothetical protein